MESVKVIPRKKIVKRLARGMEMQGRVRRVAGFGAFVDIGVGTDGLLHISELNAGKRVEKITDVVKVGDEVTVWVKDLDKENNRISLTMVAPGTLTLNDLHEGMVLNGKVTRLAPYGAFLDIGIGREGMLHVREMSDGYVQSPQDVVTVGEELEVQVLKLDAKRSRVDLSIKGLEDARAAEDMIIEDDVEEAEPPTMMELALRDAMGDELVMHKQQPKRFKKRKKANRQRQLDDIISRTIESHRLSAE